MAVITESAWHPIDDIVSKSACIPAPPVGSVAAKARTIGGGERLDMEDAAIKLAGRITVGLRC